MFLCFIIVLFFSFADAYGQSFSIGTSDITTHTQSGLHLSVGHMYITRIGAVNGAGLQSTYDTNGVVIDNTPPEVLM